MASEIGALFAFGALLFWGFGDFMIQKTARHIGDWETLFFISVFGTIILTPFIFHNLVSYLSTPQALATLIAVSLILFVAALIDFEALKKGKIAAIEPMLSLEIPVAAILSLVIINETLQPLELFLVAILIVGLCLVSLKSRHFSKKAWLETGVVLAAVAAILLGLADFLVGFGSRITNPLLINWFIDITLTIYTFIYISLRGGGIKKIVNNVKEAPRMIFAVSALDNLAWISYSFATVFIPITVAVAISENYIALAALLGLFIAGEKLLLHQKIGMVLALFSAIALALIV